MSAQPVRLAVVTALALAVPAQARAAEVPDYAMGDGPVTAKDVEGLEVVPITRAYIPEAIDLSPFMPKPGSQGRVGACVAWAAGYAVRSYYNIVRGGRPDDPDLIVSPAWLHERIRTRQKSCEEGGSTLALAIRSLKSVGSASLRQTPADTICSPTALLPPEPPVAFRIRKASYLVGPGLRFNLDRFRQVLAAGHPIPFSLRAGDNVKRLKGAEILTTPFDRARQDEADSGHAMAMVGYDDRRKAFRVLNSWGADWGDGGYGWISYAVAAQDIRFAVQFDTGTPPPRPTASRPAVAGQSDRPVQCGDVRLREDDRTYEVSGFVGESFERFLQIEDARARLDQFNANAARPKTLVDKLAVRPWPVCEAMLGLAEPLVAASRPAVATLDGRDRFRFGDTVGLSITAPDFPSYLYIVYLQADGTAVNLLPRRGAVRRQVPANTRLLFGDGRDGRGRFVAAAPSGTEAIVVIAARSPLAELEELETEGGLYAVQVAARPGDDAGGSDRPFTGSPSDRAFLSALRSALAARPDAKQIQREIAATVFHLEVVP